MQSEQAAVLLSKGSIWNPTPWEPPYLMADPGGAWPDNSYATATFTDTSGATIVEIDGDVTSKAVTFTADPEEMDQVPAGANFVIVLDTKDGPIQIRHGKVIRKEPFYATAPSGVVKPPQQFSDSFQRTALGRKWVHVGGGRSVIHHNSGISLPNGLSPNISFYTKAALRYWLPFNTNSVQVSTSVINPLNTQNGTLGIVVSADINFRSGLVAALETGINNRIRLGTMSGPTTVVPRSDTLSNTVNNNDTYTVGYSDLSKTLSIYKGSGLSPILEWTDSASIVPHGPGYQYWGLYWVASALSAGIQVTSVAGQDALGPLSPGVGGS